MDSDHASRNVKIVGLLVGALILLFWEAVANYSSAVRFFVASPIAIAEKLYELVVYKEFHRHFFITGVEAFVGLLMGCITGSITGLALWYYRSAAHIVSPLLMAFGSVPILAFAPLMIVWFGVGITLKIALAAIMTFFVAFGQATEGAKEVSKEHLDILRAIGSSRSQLFWMAVVPGSLTWVLASMRLSVGFALMGAFVGEFIASDVGLGHLILKAGSLYDVAGALAAAVGILLLAVVFDRFAVLVMRKREAIARRLSVSAVLQ